VEATYKSNITPYLILTMALPLTCGSNFNYVKKANYRSNSEVSCGTSATDDTSIDYYDCNEDVNDVIMGDTPLIQTIESQRRRRRQVNFSTVVVRDYGVTLGDHPCCSYGPPITLDWDYHQHDPVCINEFEFHQSKGRRTRREMMMNYYKRKNILSLAGFDEKDFKASKRGITRSKFHRALTKQMLQCYVVEMAVESACRKVKRLTKEDHWKSEAHLYAK